jgi:hypothetical protein
MNSLIRLHLVVLITMAGYAQAQDYVVTLKGDTLRGATKILTYNKLDKVEIRVDGKKKVFSALEARTVASKNALYHTVQLPGTGIMYMKLLRKGYLSLYGFRLPNQVAYDGLYLRKLDGQSMEVPNLTFKKSMSEFLSDCESLKEKLKSGEYGKRDLEKIVDAYNECRETQPKKPVEPVAVVDDKIQYMDELLKKLEGSDFATQKDAVDILKDIRNKSAKGETIPNYLLEGFKSSVAGQSGLAEDLQKLISLLQK